MFRMIRRALLALAVAGVAFHVPEARAQTDEDREQIKTAVLRAGELQRQGKTAEAVRECEQALDTAQRVFGPEEPITTAVMTVLASLYQALHRYAEAEPLFRRCLEIQEAKKGRDHLDVAQPLNNLATLYWAMG